jgi:16S rRNA (cytosine967-C5)-methyltransferase
MTIHWMQMMAEGVSLQSMKLHRNTSSAIVAALHTILSEGRYADKVIEKTLKLNSKWAQYDKRFIAETIYNIVRNFRFLKEISGAKGNDFWGLYGAWCVIHKIELPRWEEFDMVKPKAIKAKIEEIKSNRRIVQSIPNWLDEIAEKELGSERWEKESVALNEDAHVVLRTNTLKISRDELREQLAEHGIKSETSVEFPDALLLKNWYNVFSLQQFKDGLFEMQDAGSQLIAPFLRIEPGMRVIDACAGTGGKTLHLAALLKNKGRLIAMDNEVWKLDELRKRARRAGVSNVEAKVIESSKTIKRQENSAERLLLDVPCSGLGVLKRNPDAKWKLSAEYIEEVKMLQKKILNDYSVMLKKGGLMVYSTCSILASENEGQVQEFLNTHPDQFKLLEEKRIWPSEGFDGFYMAAIKKI